MGQSEPPSLQILAEAQREQILHEARQEADHAGYDGDGIEQGDPAHDGHGDLVVERQPHLLVEHIDQLRDVRRRARGYLQPALPVERSEEHTSELQSLMRISYAVFCLKKKKTTNDSRQNDMVASQHTTE